MLPYFLTKFLVGPTSGYLLEAFCPPVGPRQPALLWAIVGVSTIVGPIGILMGRRWLAAERGEEHATAAG